MGHLRQDIDVVDSTAGYLHVIQGRQVSHGERNVGQLTALDPQPGKSVHRLLQCLLLYVLQGGVDRRQLAETVWDLTDLDAVDKVVLGREHTCDVNMELLRSGSVSEFHS